MDLPEVGTPVKTGLREVEKSASVFVSNNGATASVGARGPERNAPEASVGSALGHGDKTLFP
jgi:hypothetical protein